MNTEYVLPSHATFSSDRPVTSGLGLLEYLEFFEDVGMEPIMAVWSGAYISRQAAGSIST